MTGTTTPTTPNPQSTQEQEASRFLHAITAIVAIGGFLYGYDTGIISGALLQITSEFSLDHRMQEWIAASILVGAVIGALGSGWMSERFGRRLTVMTVAGVFAVGAVLSALSSTPILLCLSRIFLGLAVGGSSQIIPVYIAELAPAARRGRLVTSFNLAIGLGILTASIVGFALHDVWSWRVMVAIAALPAALLCLAMLKLPETPRYLVGTEDISAARDVLEQVRTDESPINKELRSIQRTAALEARADGGWSTMGEGWVRPALIAALGVAAFTQLSGLEMMIYYTPTILTGAGFDSSSALATSVGVAIVYAVMTFIGKLLVDHVGRRRLMLVMIPGTVLSLVVLGLMFEAGLAGGEYGWLLVACLLVFMVFNSGGIQVVGWLLGSEMFPLAIRGKATSAHAATLWGSNLVVTASTLSLVHAVGVGGTMWVYAGLNFLGFVFVYYCVPETAGRSLEDIEDSLREGTFLPSQQQATASA